MNGKKEHQLEPEDASPVPIRDGTPKQGTQEERDRESDAYQRPYNLRPTRTLLKKTHLSQAVETRASHPLYRTASDAVKWEFGQQAATL